MLYIAMILGIASIGLAVWEILSYKRRKQDSVSRRFARSRLNRRLIGVLLLLNASGCVIVGELLEKSSSIERLHLLIIWGAAIISAFGVFVVVIKDIKETAQEILAHQEQLIKEAVELQESINRTCNKTKDDA